MSVHFHIKVEWDCPKSMTVFELEKYSSKNIDKSYECRDCLFPGLSSAEARDYIEILGNVPF